MKLVLTGLICQLHNLAKIAKGFRGVSFEFVEEGGKIPSLTLGATDGGSKNNSTEGSEGTTDSSQITSTEGSTESTDSVDAATEEADKKKSNKNTNRKTK